MTIDSELIGPDSTLRLTPAIARMRRSAPILLAMTAGLTVPLKAARLDVHGLSLYATYIVVAGVAVRYWREVAGYLSRWFAMPAMVLVLFAAWALVRGAGLADPTLTIGKISVAFGVAAAFGVLTRRAQDWLYRGLLAGVILTVAYMSYQMVSSTLFGFGLPFTTSARWSIGLGLSSRYGIPRVTGFTEEPSFVATMLVGATLLNVAYAYRRSKSCFLKLSVLAGGFGLAMSTSNNLFATTLIIGAFWPFVRNRRVMFLLGSYYVAALVVTPMVLLRDVTYFARFSAYDIFLRSGFIDRLLGRGTGAYERFFETNQVQFDGQEVASLASIWGAWLFEGGVVLVVLVVWWLSRIIRRAGWREGLALLALLLMLSNYNSPWWPIVSLALAECLVDRQEGVGWTTNSTSADTGQRFAGDEL